MHTVKVRIPADDDLGGCIASRSAVRNPACAEVDKLSLSCGVVGALAFSKVKCGADVFEGQPEKKIQTDRLSPAIARSGLKFSLVPVFVTDEGFKVCR